MKFSKLWLDELVPTGLGAPELCERLTMAGLEVDAMEPAAPPLAGVVVGRIVSCRGVSGAPHLQLAMVDIGRGTPLPSVCGAPNCRSGISIACAPAGTQLPGKRVAAAEIHGLSSQALLCSPRELGLSDEHGGLLELPGEAPPGQELSECLQLDDTIIDVDLTANRPDCLSLLGLARECAALLDLPPPAVPGADAAEAVCGGEPGLPVRVAVPQDCPRYLTRMVRGLDPGAVSPPWLTERLRRCGIRPLSAAVDITNYVMLECGQPLHAFDAARLHGFLEVRRARPGERLTLLTGQELLLRDDTLLIADASGPLALAGIMGGRGSGIGPGSTDVLLEAAFFAPPAIRGRARSYGLRTDASHRFERGVDPQLQAAAMERATQLLVQIAGGQPGPVTECVSPAHLPPQRDIAVRHERVERLLGIDIAPGRCRQLLARLGLEPEELPGQRLQVRVPSHRFDLELEEDVIAEIARLHGYERIPPRTPAAEMRLRAADEGCVSLQELRQVLMQCSYQEAITYSFTDPGVLSILQAPAALRLSAPLSPALSVMRTTLAAGLLGALRHNLNRQQRRVRLFETGLRYVPEDDAPQGVRQRPTLCAVAAGEAEDESWCMAQRALDFFDVKGDVERLLALYDAPGAFSFEPGTCPMLHPGQSAELWHSGASAPERRLAGHLGLLHPEVLHALELRGPVGLFELDLEALGMRALPVCRELSRFPAVRRDLAFVAERTLPAAAMAAEIRARGGELLQELRIFDVFEDAALEGRRSVAFALVLQDREATLEDARVERICEDIVAAMANKFQAVLRSRAGH